MQSTLPIVDDAKLDKLCADVKACTLCPRMAESARILSRSAGNVPAGLMFIGEAPGRLGADATGIPFHGDRTGSNFEELLAYASISRSEAFVTNAVLCNPKDGDGNNATPNADELRNCAGFLRRQIELVKPSIVVTLGAVALSALGEIEAHGLQLREHVRTTRTWYGRRLIPLYHPGQRAMIHRSFTNQRSDYQFVADELRKLSKEARPVTGTTRDEIVQIAARIIAARGPLSYFALHKLFYLVEYTFVREHGRRLSDAYFIRQKDGPYCTDLHATKLKRALPTLALRLIGAKLTLNLSPSPTRPQTPEIEETIASVLSRYRANQDSQLKTAVYLTAPMRAILRAEKASQRNLVNIPIDFLS